MTAVEAPAIPGKRPAQIHDLVGIAVRARWQGQSGRKAESAFIEGARQDAAHLVLFFGRRRPVIETKHGATDRTMAHQWREVDADPLGIQGLAVAVQAVPPPRNVAGDRKE